MEKLPELIDWAPEGATMLLFGGETLLPKANKFLIPGSDRRFLFVVSKD
jgi:hypothetical protein